jgi:hypothetical protein
VASTRAHGVVGFDHASGRTSRLGSQSELLALPRALHRRVAGSCATPRTRHRRPNRARSSIVPCEHRDEVRSRAVLKLMQERTGPLATREWTLASGWRRCCLLARWSARRAAVPRPRIGRSDIARALIGGLRCRSWDSSVAACWVRHGPSVVLRSPDRPAGPAAHGRTVLVARESEAGRTHGDERAHARADRKRRRPAPRRFRVRIAGHAAPTRRSVAEVVRAPMGPSREPRSHHRDQRSLDGTRAWSMRTKFRPQSPLRQVPPRYIPRRTRRGFAVGGRTARCASVQNRPDELKVSVLR